MDTSNHLNIAIIEISFSSDKFSSEAFVTIMNEKEHIPNEAVQEKTAAVTINIFNICTSFFVKTFRVGTIYLAGYFNTNPLWLLGILLVFIYRDRQRLDKRFKQQVAMAISLRNDRQLVLANVTRPPAWVYFPEIERCEWLNKVLTHLWPSMTQFAEKFIKSTVEPSINEALSSYKKNLNFKFHNFRLGGIVPRVCGLQVYDKHTRHYESIIIDMNLFYAGDSDISFSIMSLNGGIQNIEISGWIRIVISLLEAPLPILAGIEIFFLHKPKIDFNLTGVTNILEIPGLNGIMRKTIDDQIGSQMVLPKKITLKINDIVDSGHWKCPDPEGLLLVHVIEAKDLRSNGSGFFGSGTSDPYVEVTFGSKTIMSEFIENSLNPEWNFWADFIIDSTFSKTFSITVNERNGKESLGNVSLELNMAEEKKQIDSWIQLDDTNTGMIHLGIYYYNISCNPNKILNTELPYLLIVFINNGYNIVNPRSKKTPNSVVHLSINEDIQFSKPVSSNNPAYEEVFSFLVNNPKNDKLQVKIIDRNTKTDLGNATLLLKRVLEASELEIIDQQCPLMNTTTESFIVLSTRLRILTNSKELE